MGTIEEASAMTEASGLTDEQRIDHAAESIRALAGGTAGASSAGPHSFSDALRRLTVEAPLQSLAIAFLLGVLVAWRR